MAENVSKIHNYAMRFLRKRERPAENVALASIAAAVTAVFSLLMAFFPSLSVAAVFLLPLASALIGFLCQGKYLIPYVIASSFVSFAVASFNPAEAIFTVIPAVVIGTALGFAFRKRVPDALWLVAIAILQAALDYGIAAILKYGFSLDPIETFRNMFSLADDDNFRSWLPAAIFGIAYAQTTITGVFIYIIFSSRIQREAENPLWAMILSDALGIALSVVALALGPFESISAHLLFALSIPFAAQSIANLHGEKRIWIYAMMIALLFISIYARAMLAEYYPDAICLMCLFGLSLDLSALVSNLLHIRRKI